MQPGDSNEIIPNLGFVFKVEISLLCGHCLAGRFIYLPMQLKPRFLDFSTVFHNNPILAELLQ